MKDEGPARGLILDPRSSILDPSFFLLQRDFQHDLAALRKLDGIVDEIDHDLPQSRVVAHDPSGHILMDVAGQLQALLVGADSERFHRVAEAFPQVELLAIQHELLGLDLGEVEDIVQHAEQGFARIADRRQKLALLGRELGLEDQFGHADHGVQGRANFMAHVRQETALGPTGRFGRVSGGPQCFRHPLLRGDVLGNAETAHDLPRVVIQWQFRAGCPGGTPVRPGFFLFLVDDPLSGAYDFLLVSQGLEGVFVGEEVDVGLADRVAGILQSEVPRHRLIDANEAALGVLEVNVVRQVIHERLQQVAFLLQALVGGRKFGGAILDTLLQFGVGLAQFLFRPAEGAEQRSNSRQSGK